LNFFEAQDRARRNTSWLVVLFLLAVVGLVFLTNLFLLAILTFAKTSQFSFSLEALQQVYSWREFVLVSAGIGLLILGGSLYKTLSLSGGGATVAEMLGGRLITQSTTDLHQRQLLNVVEEMAIAAGMPIPRVYLLDDTAINAFAAGRTPTSAVIGVTRGTLMRLNREELQAVIAHEFSHIANGDMRLNIRLIGLLHGILLIGLIGYFILRSMRFAGRSRNSKAAGGIAAIAALGMGLMIIGYTGSFFGQCIKAIVSRQREYLADSSAVQFTRNKDGIANALKKIGGASVGSFIESPLAPQYSHAFFANGISSFWQSMFATHPPLERRIRAIEPRWNGEFLLSEILQSVATVVEAPAARPSGLAMAAAVLSSAEQAIVQVGTLNEENIQYVRELLIATPMILREAAQDAYSARALIYASLLKMQSDAQAASAALGKAVDPDIEALALKLLPALRQLDDKLKLPLLELCINTLKDLSPNQFVQFKITVDNIIASDKSVNLQEWVVQRLLVQQLDEHFGFRKPARAKHKSLDAVRADVEILLSLIACVEHKNDAEAQLAFSAGVREAGIEMSMPDRKSFKLAALNASLDNLMRLKPLAKPRLLKACVAVILQDGKTTTRGIELVRTISTCLDCPMPPLRAATAD